MTLDGKRPMWPSLVFTTFVSTLWVEDMCFSKKLADVSVALSKGEEGSVGSSQASPWAVESPLPVLQVERERLQVGSRSRAVPCTRSSRTPHTGLNVQPQMFFGWSFNGTYDTGRHADWKFFSNDNGIGCHQLWWYFHTKKKQRPSPFKYVLEKASYSKCKLCITQRAKLCKTLAFHWSQTWPKPDWLGWPESPGRPWPPPPPAWQPPRWPPRQYTCPEQTLCPFFSPNQSIEDNFKKKKLSWPPPQPSCQLPRAPPTQPPWWPCPWSPPTTQNTGRMVNNCQSWEMANFQFRYQCI